jgi:hypothetical protein
LAIKETRGEIITWFDDDDWQHPEKLSWIVEALQCDALYAGCCCAWFVDLIGSTCIRYRGWRERILFNSAGFRREAVLPISFAENLRKGSDTVWMRDLAARHYSKAAIIERDDLFFWLCHQRNLSNPAKIKRFPERLEVLKDRIGADAWGDTDDALNALKTRLLCESRGQAGSPGALISVPPQRAELRPKTTANYDKAVTSIPVSLMIKATVMDAPFLDIMVRHMIAQAGCSFSERAMSSIVSRR